MSSITPQHSYKVKKVTFHGRDAQIFMQNLNGPCPLLSIANVLSLRNLLRDVPRDAPDISESRLVSLVAGQYLDSNKIDENSEYAENLAQNLQDGLEVLHKLTTGIDVNLKFNSVTGFEPTREVAIFDLLDIHLVHGWLVDPQDTLTAHALGGKSYNELVELLVVALGEEAASRLPSRQTTISNHHDVVHSQPQASCEFQRELQAALELSLAGDVDASCSPALCSGDDEGIVVDACIDDIVSDVITEAGICQPREACHELSCSGGSSAAAPTADEAAVVQGDTLQEALLVRNFLEVNCNQLTVHGLAQLYGQLKEHQLAVFFRNNHFNTMYKHEGALYLLVTDQGYLMEPDVVWERLDTVDGDTQLCDSHFLPFQPHREAAGAARRGSEGEVDLDTLAALTADLEAQEAAALGLAGTGAASAHEDADFALALALQEQEEQQYQQQQRQQEAEQQHRQQPQSSWQQQQQQQPMQPLAETRHPQQELHARNPLHVQEQSRLSSGTAQRPMGWLRQTVGQPQVRPAGGGDASQPPKEKCTIM